jgi:GDP-4-dehydro-6-deoxy-D-mannose reductase
MPVNEKEEARPVSAYGRSKAEQTRLGLRYFSEQGRRVYIARPFNIIGPGQPQSLLCSAIARQVVRIEQSRQKPVVEIGNLDPVRDFIDVRDVARAYWDIVSKGIPGEIYNICSGRPLSVRDIIDMLGSISGVKFDIKQVPELVRMSDIPVMVGDNSKIRAATGWQPAITVEQTLKDILQELRADPSLTK